MSICPTGNWSGGRHTGIRAKRYTICMYTGLSAKVSLFLYVRSRAQIEYYLNLADAARAANESVHRSSEPKTSERKHEGAKIIEINSVSRHSQG
jgi:hypothetical protein